MTHENNSNDRARPTPPGRETEDDLVGRLVRLADSGPELPAGGAQQIKDALRDAWRMEVSQRRRRRLALWGSGTLVAAAGLVLAVSSVIDRAPTQSPRAVALGRIAAVWGQCELIPPAGAPAQRLTQGSETVVVAGSRLLTNTSGRIAVDLIDGESLRLDTGSAVRLTAPGRILLDRGALYVDSHGSSAGVVIATQLGQVRDIGTQFEVRYQGDALTVRVREGSVRLNRAEGRIEVGAGSSIDVLSDGSTVMGAAAANGAEWQWAISAAPPFEIEGRTADEFLRWVARETGLELTYTDAGSRDLAQTCVLHGTLAGVAPPQAPAVVLPSCTMSHRIDSGRLMVGTADAFSEERTPGST